MNDLTPEQKSHALKVATEGVVAMQEQLASLGLSDRDTKLFYVFRAGCDDLWASVIDQSSGEAKFVQAIRAYFIHISEDLQRLVDQHG